MVRRRQSTQTDIDVLDDIRTGLRIHPDGHNSTSYGNDNREGLNEVHARSAHSQSVGRSKQRHVSGSSTAVSIPPALPSPEEDIRGISPRSHRVALTPPSSAKVARFANGFGLKPVVAGQAASRPSKRSDSVDLSQAEGGAFLSAIDGEPSGDRSAMMKAPSSILSVFLRAFRGRKIFLFLITCVLIALFVLGPTDRRNEVMLKANNAWSEGWEHTDKYLDKAGDFLQDMRKGKEGKAGAVHPVPPQGQVDVAPKPDIDPHRIEIPPMEAQNSEKEASILDAVRKMPAPHPDKLKTTRCNSNDNSIFDAHKKSRPTVQYAIMIDAGSTGSRVHVYRFNFCKESPELEEETFKMIQGGLSSFKADATGAAHSLKPLLEKALETVPESKHACTPIAVKATAGLRLLGAEMSKNILQAVRHMLEKEYPFPIADGPGRNGVEIMEGRDEGVFAWITVNYLLNRIGTELHNDGDNKDAKTAAVLDLGGASTQIVFEPIYPSDTQGMHPGEHVYELSNFGGRKYTLYQNSYLGYGLMEARKSINSLSYLSYSLAHPDMVRTGSLPEKVVAAESSDVVKGLSQPSIKVPSPCFAEGRSKEVPVRLPGQVDEASVTMFGTAGGFDACKRLVEVMMDKDAVCRKPPCSFAGVYQPSLMTAFAKSPIVALSYFYDRLTPLGLNGTFKLSELTELTRKVCTPPEEWPKHFGAKGSSKAADTALAELEDRPDSCLDLTFLTTLLRLGYELDDTRSVTVAKKLSGNELGWCLGAQLQVLQDGVICKRV